MKKLSIQEMQNRLDNDNNIYQSIILNDNVHHTHVKCGKCGVEFFTPYHTLLRNKFKTCPKCAKQLKSTKLCNINKVKEEIISYGFIPLFDEYKGCHSLFTVQDKDGYKGTLSLVSMRRGANISYFAKYNIYALDNLRKYCQDNGIECIIPDQEYKGWDLPLKVVCSCGKEYETTVSHFIHDNQHQCLDCSGSKSSNEKVIEEWFGLNNINFIPQYKFEDCVYHKSLPFDFYLPEYNCCVEIDGEGHERPTRFNGINKYRAQLLFEQTKIRDNIKTNYCKNHGVCLIRIDYRDIQNQNYKNILSSIIR